MVLARRVILHIGQTKAASTSIQNYLDRERASLAARGILFPVTGFTRRNPFDRDRSSGHLHLFRDIAGESGSALAEECAAFGPDGPEILVLSAENLLLDFPDEGLAAVGGFLGGPPLTLAAILRHPAEWLPSRYVESVGGGWLAAARRPETFVENVVRLGNLDYAARLERVAGLLNASDVRVFNFSALMRDERGTVGAFLAGLGLLEEGVGRVPDIRDNVTRMPAVGVEALRRLNPLLADQPVPLRLAVSASMAEEAEARTAADDRLDTPFQLTPALLDRVLHLVEAPLDRLNASYLADAPLTYDPPRHQPAPPPDVFEAMVQDLVLAGLRRVLGLSELAAARRPGASLADMTTEQVDLVMPALRRARVSLHLDCRLWALLAATLDRRFVLAAEPQDSLSALRRLCDAADQPSAMVATALAGDPLLELVPLLPRTPDLVVVGAAVDPRPVLSWLSRTGGGPVEVILSGSAAPPLQDARVLTQAGGLSLWRLEARPEGGLS